MTGIRFKRLMPRSLVLIFLLLGSVTHAEVVIVNAQINPELDRNQLRAIFSMQYNKWPDGTPMAVFIYDELSPLHQRFCKKTLRIYPYQLKKNWERLIYSGTGQGPEKVSSESEMVRRVATTPGAIGYISEGSDINGVSVVNIDAN